MTTKYCAHCKTYNLNTSKCMIDNKSKNPDSICDKNTKTSNKS
jgi:hypothetical protein